MIESTYKHISCDYNSVISHPSPAQPSLLVASRWLLLILLWTGLPLDYQSYAWDLLCIVIFRPRQTAGRWEGLLEGYVNLSLYIGPLIPAILSLGLSMILFPMGKKLTNTSEFYIYAFLPCLPFPPPQFHNLNQLGFYCLLRHLQAGILQLLCLSLGHTASPSTSLYITIITNNCQHNL